MGAFNRTWESLVPGLWRCDLHADSRVCPYTIVLIKVTTPQYHGLSLQSVIVRSLGCRPAPDVAAYLTDLVLAPGMPLSCQLYGLQSLLLSSCLLRLPSKFHVVVPFSRVVQGLAKQDWPICASGWLIDELGSWDPIKNGGRDNASLDDSVSSSCS